MSYDYGAWENFLDKVWAPIQLIIVNADVIVRYLKNRSKFLKKFIVTTNVSGRLRITKKL